MNVFVVYLQGWERSKNRGNIQQYCFDNFLSANTLKVKIGF